MQLINIPGEYKQTKRVPVSPAYSTLQFLGQVRSTPLISIYLTTGYGLWSNIITVYLCANSVMPALRELGKNCVGAAD